MVSTVPYSGSDFLAELHSDWATTDRKETTVPDARIRNVTPPVVTSKIRVTLSRQLTWAEVEALETDNTDPHFRRLKDTGNDFRLWVDKEVMDEIWVDARMGSRLSYELVAATLETHFVNVYPIAVWTKREYNGD